MAFKNRNFSVLAYANGFTLWHYTTNEDTLKQIYDKSYWDKGVAVLANTGDIMIVNASDGTAIRKVELTDGSMKLTKLN